MPRLATLTRAELIEWVGGRRNLALELQTKDHAQAYADVIRHYDALIDLLKADGLLRKAITVEQLKDDADDGESLIAIFKAMEHP